MRVALTVAVGLVGASLAAAAMAAGQPASDQSSGDTPSIVRERIDLRQGIYQSSHILQQLPRALPAYVAAGLAVILLAHLFGFFEMGATSILILLALIGAIVYRFYWPPWR
jgi:hypothetical protein